MGTRIVSWCRAHRLAAVTIVAAALVVCCRYVAPSVLWLPLAVALGAAAPLLTRRASRDAALTRLVAAAFIVRAAVAIGLFAISALDLPILPSQHRGEGLWEFGGDGEGYHDHALKLLDAWRSGIDLGSAFVVGDVTYDLYKGLSLPMAAVYGLMGPSPLHFMLFNVWLGAICGLLAYRLALRLGGDRRAALAAAALVAFWPSSLLWSSQLLKDTLTLALLMWAMDLVIDIWQRHSRSAPGRPQPAATFVRWATLAGVVFVVTYFRNQAAAVLTGAAAVVFAAASARAALHGHWKQIVAGAGLTLVVAAATLAGVRIDPLEVFSPRHPEIGYVRRGDQYLHQHQLPAALTAYRRAIGFNSEFAAAYRGLALVLNEQGDNTAAEQALRIYETLEPDARRREGLHARLTSPPAPSASLDSTAPPDHQAVLSGPAPTPPSSTLIASPERGASPVPVTSPAPITSPVPIMTRPGAVVAEVRRTVARGLAWLSAERITTLRNAQIAAGGTSTNDPDVRFANMGELLMYMPRAFAIAYLSPFPAQLAFTGGQSGILRPLAAPEIVLIALLLPAFLIACYQRVRRFRPEEWLIMIFIAVMAVAHGIVMVNAGTLFRLRLQYLFPSLVLASTTLPAFVYRFVDKMARRSTRAAVAADDTIASRAS
jgi:hypothetical protein